jgi:hypothetical protein
MEEHRRDHVCWPVAVPYKQNLAASVSQCLHSVLRNVAVGDPISAVVGALVTSGQYRTPR